VTPEEIELLSELTIVIPTYNRPLELERSIEYWRDMPVTVHFIDGSENSWFLIDSLENVPNITYHHLPAEKSQNPLESIFQRIVFSSKLPTTKFSAFGCDDDFYTITGLVESLKLLNSNRLIDAVAGRVITYRKKTDVEVLWWCKYLGWKDSESLRSEDIRVRAEQKGNWFLYAVCRTDLWQKYLLTSYTPKSYTESQHQAHDWLMTRLSSVLFRTFFLERIMTVRQVTIEGRNKAPTLSWHDWLTLNEYSEQILELRSQLCKGLLAVSSDRAVNEVIANRLVDARIHDVLMEKSRIKRLEHPSSSIKRRIAKNVPDWIKNMYVLTLPASSALGIKSYRLRLFLSLLNRWGVEFDREEIVSIEKLLLKPREELRLKANI
jgi:glycosyltransferase domain-containing protein